MSLNLIIHSFYPAESISRFNMSENYQIKLQPRSITGINKIGLYTLAAREVSRFSTIYLQTIIAPVVTTFLYYIIFALAFGGIARNIGGVPFLQFLMPGLIMMTMAQNAFANTSSSLVIAKIQGNIVDVLMPPLSSLELYLGYVAGGVARGIMVGASTGLIMAFFVDLSVQHWGLLIAFSILGMLMLGSLGILAGIWAQKFDHIAAVSNFVVTPLTFLSGTFYSLDVLPETWQAIALFNPFFYMIDGFRTSFTGNADGPYMIGLVVLVVVNLVLAFWAYMMFKTGYKMKS